jgi:hypothetical protein
MRFRLLVSVLLALLLRAPGFADTVYLANGRSFEGVIAQESADEVKIQMPGGSLSLPRSHVLRVEKSESDFAEYMRRKAALRRDAGAGEWVKLARWAKTQGLEQGVREAALVAADLDPHAEGLAPLLRGYGYVLDEQLDRWIPYADSMRRKGLVQWNGQWISHQEHEARLRAEREESERRNAERMAARTAQATQAAREAELALAEMALRERLAETSAPQGIPLYGGVPLYISPWYVPPIQTPRPCHHCGSNPPPHQMPPPSPPPHRQGPSSTVTHVPGSLIPGRIDTMSSSSQR